MARSKYRMDLLPPRALLAVGKTLEEGARKHGAYTWQNAPPEEHLNHVMIHLSSFLGGEFAYDRKAKTHLAHAATRLLMCLDCVLAQQKVKNTQ